jgi:transposase
VDERAVLTCYEIALVSARRRNCPNNSAIFLDLLNQGAEAHGFVGDVWTQQRIAIVIKRIFGVSYHPDHIGRLLRSIG